MPNAADPKAVARAKKKEMFGRDQELNDIRFVMSEPQGRRFMWRLLGKCGINGQPFVVRDNSLTSFKCGELNIGRFLQAEVGEANQEAYFEMAREARADEEKSK